MSKYELLTVVFFGSFCRVTRLFGAHCSIFFGSFSPLSSFYLALQPGNYHLSFPFHPCFLTYGQEHASSHKKCFDKIGLVICAIASDEKFGEAEVTKILTSKCLDLDQQLIHLGLENNIALLDV